MSILIQKSANLKTISYRNLPGGLICGCEPTQLSFKNTQRQRVARFRELLDQLNEAKRQGMTHKTWITSSDPRTRESHRRLHRLRIGIDEEFRIGVNRLQTPSDPSGSFAETANCRCSLVFDRVANEVPHMGQVRPVEPTPSNDQTFDFVAARFIRLRVATDSIVPLFAGFAYKVTATPIDARGRPTGVLSRFRPGMRNFAREGEPIDNPLVFQNEAAVTGGDPFEIRFDAGFNSPFGFRWEVEGSQPPGPDNQGQLYWSVWRDGR